MIDRPAREAIAKMVRAYMAGQLTTDQFEDGVYAAARSTQDAVVTGIPLSFWAQFDTGHGFRPMTGKADWDLLNRQLLLLASEAEWQQPASGPRVWRGRQVLAAMALLAYLAMAAYLGWQEGLDSVDWGILSLLFGPASWFLAHEPQPSRPTAEAALDGVLAPFPSLAALGRVRRAVPGFTRRPCPPSLAQSTNPPSRLSAGIDAGIAAVHTVCAMLCWCQAAPLLLLMQAWPRRLVPDAELIIPAPAKPDHVA